MKNIRHNCKHHCKPCIVVENHNEASTMNYVWPIPQRLYLRVGHGKIWHGWQALTNQHFAHFAYCDGQSHGQWRLAGCILFWGGLSNNPKCIMGFLKTHESNNSLRHWGRVTHICFTKQWLINNGLAPGHHLKQCWDIINWTLKNNLQWNFNQNSYISFKKMHLKMLSVKWCPFCLCLNVLYNTYLDTAKSLSELPWASLGTNFC